MIFANNIAKDNNIVWQLFQASGDDLTFSCFRGAPVLHVAEAFTQQYSDMSTYVFTGESKQLEEPDQDGAGEHDEAPEERPPGKIIDVITDAEADAIAPAEEKTRKKRSLRMGNKMVAQCGWGPANGEDSVVDVVQPDLLQQVEDEIHDLVGFMDDLEVVSRHSVAFNMWLGDNNVAQREIRLATTLGEIRDRMEALRMIIPRLDIVEYIDRAKKEKAILEYLEYYWYGNHRPCLIVQNLSGLFLNPEDIEPETIMAYNISGTIVQYPAGYLWESEGERVVAQGLFGDSHITLENTDAALTQNVVPKLVQALDGTESLGSSLTATLSEARETCSHINDTSTKLNGVIDSISGAVLANRGILDLVDLGRDLYFLIRADSSASFTMHALCTFKHFILDKVTLQKAESFLHQMSDNFPGNDNKGARSQAGEECTVIKSIVSIITALIGFSMFGVKFKWDGIGNFAKTLVDTCKDLTWIRNGAHTLAELASAVSGVIKPAVEWVMGRIYPDYKVIQLLEERGPEISEWVKKVDYVNSPEFGDTFNWNMEAHDLVDELMDKMYDFEASFLRVGSNGKGMGIIRDASKVLREVKNRALKARLAPPFRIDPFFIYFFGEPRIGKSFVSNRLVVDIGDRLGLRTHGRMYPRNVADQYWSGYKGQPCVVFDDFAQIIDEKHIESMFSLKSNNACLLTMADLEDKGRGFVSKVLIGNSNVAYPDCNNVRSIHAFWSRRNALVEVVLVDQESSFDIRKIRSGSLDHLRFRLVHPYDAKGTPLTTFMTYNDFLDYIVDDMRDYLKNQEEMVRDMLVSMGYEMLIDKWYDTNDETLIPKMNYENGDLTDSGIDSDKDDRVSVGEKPGTSGMCGVSQAGLSEEFKDFIVKFRALPESDKRYVARIYKIIERDLERSAADEMVIPRSDASRSTLDFLADLDVWLTKREIEISQLMTYCYMFNVTPSFFLMERTAISTKRSRWDCIMSKGRSIVTRFKNWVSGLFSSFARWYRETNIYDKLNTVLLMLAGIKAVNWATGWFQDSSMVSTLENIVRGPTTNERIVGAVVKSAVMAGENLTTKATEMMDDYANSFGSPPTTMSESSSNNSLNESIEKIEQKIGELRNDRVLLQAASPTIEQSSIAEGKYYPGWWNKKFGAKVKRQVVAQGTDDAKALVIRNERVMPYMFRIRVSSETPWTMNAFALVGRILMMNTHFFEYVVDRFEILHNGVWVPYTYDGDSRFDIVGKDVTLYQMPVKWRQFRSNVLHFVKEKDLNKYSKIDVELVTSMYNGEFLIYQTVASRMSNLRYEIENKNKEIELQYGWLYKANTQGGDCGAILVAYCPGLNEKLIGVHCAGCKTSPRGFGSLLTQEILLKALTNFTEQSKLGIPLPPIISQCGMKVAPVGYFSVVGCVSDKNSVMPPIQTNIRRTALYEIFGPHLTEPAVLGTKDPRNMSGVSPLSIAVCKYGNMVLDFPQSDVNDIVEDMIRMTRNWKTLRDPQLLTDEEIIKGIDGMDFFDAMNMQSSPGWPYNLRHDGCIGKTGLILSDGTIDDELKQNCELRERLALKGERVVSVWVDCLKDERRSIDKIKRGKTRLFTVPPVDFTMICRKYTLDFAAAFYLNRNKFFSAVGMDPYSPEWHEWYTRLAENSEFAIAGDFGSFDGNVSVQLMFAVCSIMNAWYGDDFGHVREVLFDEIAHTVQLCMNGIYITHHGVPSGNPLTVVINTIVNAMYMRLCWKRLARENEPGMVSMIDYHRNIKESMYGDDNVLTIKAHVINWYNQETISNVLLLHGIEYTDETKEGICMPFKTLDECTFLKNGIGTLKELGFLKVAKMEISVLEEMVYWCHKNDDELEVLEEIIECSARMMFFHGLEKYNKWKDRIDRSLVEQDLCLNVYSFNELKEIYQDKFGIGAKI